jgi:hypothetical protein
LCDVRKAGAALAIRPPGSGENLGGEQFARKHPIVPKG